LILDTFGEVTELIYNCVETAENEKDRATASMLQWYVNEQIEEEANVDNVNNQLTVLNQ
jgi:ferritin